MGQWQRGQGAPQPWGGPQWPPQPPQGPQGPQGPPGPPGPPVTASRGGRLHGVLVGLGVLLVCAAVAITVAVAGTQQRVRAHGTPGPGPANPSDGVTLTPVPTTPATVSTRNGEIVTLPKGCQILPEADLHRYLGDVVNPHDDDTSGDARSCTWDNFGGSTGKSISLILNVRLSDSDDEAHDSLTTGECGGSQVKPVKVPGTEEACADLTVTSDSASVKARYHNAVIRVDYIVAETESAQDEPTAIAVAARVAQILAG